MRQVADVTVANTTTDRIIKQVVNAWKAQNKIVTTLATKSEDEMYHNEAAPGRNRGIYLLGHLIAVNDGMLPLLGLGERLYPELDEAFVTNADKTIASLPTMEELRQKWDTLNMTLTEHFGYMSSEEWMEKHTRVSDEDFAADPLRNKLNILIGRTGHEAYHAGQLAFVNPRN